MEEAEAQKEEAVGSRSHSAYLVKLGVKSSSKTHFSPPGVEEQLVGGLWGLGPLLASPLSSCVTLGEWLDLSWAQLPQPPTGEDVQEHPLR